MTDIVVIAGATASGKTRLAIELAKRFSGEIVSADSMQIYRKMDIGTAKPTKEEQREARHHMIDVCDVTDNFSVSDYVKGARSAIEDIVSRGKLPIIAGGTGMYIDCLAGRMALDRPKCDENIRRELTDIYERFGADALYEIFLNEADWERRSKIHKNDIKRVMRAIEQARSGENEKTEDFTKMYNSLWFSIDIERERLYNRIDGRVDKMFEEGLLEEVENVMLPVRKFCTTSLQSIGYKEVLMYFDKLLTLGETVELIKKRTRNYAKRQLTWFRRNGEINYLKEENAAGAAEDMIRKAFCI